MLWTAPERVFCGTELDITQEGALAVLAAEACSLGHREPLTPLAAFVAADIPDQP